MFLKAVPFHPSSRPIPHSTMRIAHLSYYYGTKNTSAVVDDMRCLLRLIPQNWGINYLLNFKTIENTGVSSIPCGSGNPTDFFS